MAALEVKDLAGLSEPMKKLIEVCAEGIGAVARPWLIKRDAKALAAAQDALQQAGLEVGSTNVPSIQAQIAARVEYRETKRHNNLYRIVTAAKESLADEVDKEQVDEDWISRFFSYAQDVSNEEMQQIWGCLLSGEVARPGTFSLRTLEVVRSLSAKEAITFHKLSTFVLRGRFCLSPQPLIGKFGKRASEFEIHGGSDDWGKFYEKNGITDEDFKLLEEIQLITSAINSRTWTWEAKDSATPIIIDFKHEKGIAIVNNTPTDTPWSVTVAGQDLTHIGQQIVQIAPSPDYPLELLKQLDSAAQRQGLSCKVAKVTTDPDTGTKKFHLYDICDK